MSKKIPYRIPVCIFIFVVGSITALLFASVLNDVLTTGSISTDLTDFSTIFSGVFGGEKPRKLYLLLEALVVLLCVVYFVCAERTYQTETYKVTDNISVPVPSGQGQHGTAWFMSDKIKRRAFDYISISKADPLISRLVSIGEERYRAIENGEIFNPPKADQTLTDSAGIVLAREMSRGTERLPCITDDYHTLTIGATRCGKSRCLVLQSICALALAGEGIVANDPKGELYHYTHSFLETLGYKVHVIDFNTPKKSDRYNPLQSIINAVNENRIDDAQNCVWEFVTFLVEKNDHSEPIWTNGECSVIAAAVMCVVYDNQNHPEFQNLTNVYNFIANMCKTVNKVLPIDAYMDKLPDSHPAKKLMAIAKLAPDKMGGSFYTAALTTLRLFITNDMKNRTLIGIILIAAAIGLCFGISPLFNSILSSKTKIIRLRQDIPQGVQITGAMLEAVEVGTLNLPADIQNDPKEIIGKYTVSAMFAGDSFTDKKLSDSIDTSDSLLRQLKPNETAMSVTVRSLANGLSGKLQQGDIIQIVSVDEDDKAQIYEELQYV